jgi:uncharacterized protein (DUF1778 family)
MTTQMRSRLVVFRLSEDEYRTLREACESRGGRNVSDFTRSEVLDYLKSVSLPDNAQVRCAALEQEIAGLKAAVTHLNGWLETKSRAGGTEASRERANSPADQALTRP